MPTFRKQTVKIAFSKPGMEYQKRRIKSNIQYKEVDALVCGKIALHKTVTNDGDKPDKPYTLTHIPTGFVIHQMNSHDRAKKLVLELTRAGNWDFTNPNHIPRELLQAIAPIMSKVENRYG